MNTFKRSLIQASTLVLAATVAADTLATKPSWAKGPKNSVHYATVISADPVYTQVERRQPQQHCWNEQVRVRGGQNTTGNILGGLIGGAIGNELGHNKSNKKVGAVAGAILGASIANDVQGNKHRQYHSVERCSTTYNSYYEQQLNGYEVSYRYNGITYHSHFPHHPGKRVRVAVSVSPVF